MGFDMDVTLSGGHGNCTVTVTIANEAGVEGTGSITFDPRDPTTWSHGEPRTARVGSR
jgi:hypothetical protein